MAQDTLPAQSGTPVTEVDVANANNLNQAINAIRSQLGDGNTAANAVLNSIAAAIPTSIIGGTTGTTANRALVAKGTTGFALQPTVLTIDPATGVVAGTAVWNGSAIGPAFGGTGIANNPSSTLTWSGSFATTFTRTGPTNVTFPTSGTLATLNTNTWVQQQGFALQTLTDAATVAWNLQTQQTAIVTLGGNRAMGTPTNILAGYTYAVIVVQDATGNRTLSWPNPPFKWPGGSAPVLSTAANAVDVFTFVAQSTSLLLGVGQKAFA